MNIGELIRPYRLAQGISQAALARYAGYTDRSSVAKIESGEVDLPLSKLTAIVHALGIPRDAVIDIVMGGNNLGRTEI